MNPYIFRGYWADVGTIESFYDANIQLTRRGAPFNFFHPRWPIYTHPRFLPATRVFDSQLESSIVAEGCYVDRCTVSSSVVGIRTRISPGAAITRSVLLGADFYEEDTEANAIPLGIGRDVVLDRVIVDKNARIGDSVRLVNEAGVQHADGDGYHIRSGIIIIPKGARVSPGRSCERVRIRPAGLRGQRSGELRPASRSNYRVGTGPNVFTATSGKSVNTPSTPSPRNCSNSASARPW